MQYDNDLRKLGGCKPMPPSERFYKRFTVADNGCWMWIGSPHGSNSYGRIKVDGKSKQAHRYSYELHVDEIPDGLFVLHKCDTPLCVNPEHLFVGTHQDNMDDCRRKGRTNGGTKTPLHGVMHPNSKLTERHVLDIRKDDRLQRIIAAEYGVSQALIQNIKSRKAWRHI